MLDRLSTQHLRNADKQKASQHTVIMSSLNVAASSLNLAAYFYMLSSPVLAPLMETAQYIFLPFAAVTSIINAILAWRYARLNRHEPHTFLRAVIETAVAIALAVAVIASLVLGATFTLAGDIIFAAALAGNIISSRVCYLFCGHGEPHRQSCQKRRTAHPRQRCID